MQLYRPSAEDLDLLHLKRSCLRHMANRHLRDQRSTSTCDVSDSTSTAPASRPTTADRDGYDQLRPDAEEMEFDGQSPRHQQSTTREGTPSDPDRPPKPPTPSPTTALFSGSANASAASLGAILNGSCRRTIAHHIHLNRLKRTCRYFPPPRHRSNHPSSLLSFPRETRAQHHHRGVPPTYPKVLSDDQRGVPRPSGVL